MDNWTFNWLNFRQPEPEWVKGVYRYEEGLSALINRRMQMFGDRNTFWGKHRGELSGLDTLAKFPDSAYWRIPEDPFTAIPSPDLRVMLLKRRYLNRLRQTLLKYKRRGKFVRHYYL